jgi:hypothetical protein
MRKSILAVAIISGSIAAVMGPAPAVARPAPPEPSSCSTGYQEAWADRSFVGATNGQPQGNAERPKEGEIIGVGCFNRHGNRLTVAFTWTSVGKLYSALFRIMIEDCGSGAHPFGVVRMDYPNGSHGKLRESTSFIRTGITGRRYRLIIQGVGSYERTPDVRGEGSVGWFQSLLNDYPKFRDSTGLCI